MTFISKSGESYDLFLKADGSLDDLSYVSSSRDNVLLDTKITSGSYTNAYLTLYKIIVGSYTIGIRVEAQIHDRLLSDNGTVTKSSYTIDSAYRPKGPVILSAETQRGYRYTRSTHIWLDTYYLCTVGCATTVNNDDPDYSSTYAYRSCSGMYFITPIMEV